MSKNTKSLPENSGLPDDVELAMLKASGSVDGLSDEVLLAMSRAGRAVQDTFPPVTMPKTAGETRLGTVFGPVQQQVDEIAGDEPMR